MFVRQGLQPCSVPRGAKLPDNASAGPGRRLTVSRRWRPTCAAARLLAALWAEVLDERTSVGQRTLILNGPSTISVEWALLHRAKE